MCSDAIASDQLFVMQDIAKDSRFRKLSLVVDEPHLRYYASMPLVTSRRAVIGTLCVADLKPRELTPAQAGAFPVLAAQMMSLLEQRRLAKMRDTIIRAVDRELRAEVDSLRKLSAGTL